MKKWVRWQGIVFFVCLTVFFSFLWLVLVDVFVERMVEKYGTRVVGAKVELDNAKVRLFPLEIRLNHLQVTNPDAPMTNAVEIARIGFSVDGLKLLRRKVIIDEMSLETLRINTPRKRSGAISAKTKRVPGGLEKKARQIFSFPALELPNVKEILEKEELRSLDLMNTVRSDIQAEKVRWKGLLQEIPGEERIAEYRKRIEAVKSAKKGGLSGILGGAAEAVAIKKDIERDFQRIKNAQKEFKEKLAYLKQRMDEAIKAPQEDIRRLTEKYALSSQGLANVSRMLLGPKIGLWIDRALVWREKLKPFVERATEDKEKSHKVVKPIRGRGVNVVYKERTPLPDFLIRRVSASLQLQVGDLSGTIKNITPDQDILGSPLTFIFFGDRLKNAESVKIEGTLDHIIPSESHDNMKVHLKGYRLRAIPLSDQQELPITLKEGLLDLKIDTELKGHIIAAKIDADLKTVRITAGTEESAGQLARSVASALSDISKFMVRIDLVGVLADYKINITSDLDRIVKDSVRKMAGEQAAILEKRLRSAVYAKVEGPIKDLGQNLDQLSPVGNELTDRLGQERELLNVLSIRPDRGGFRLPF